MPGQPKNTWAQTVLSLQCDLEREACLSSYASRYAECYSPPASLGNLAANDYALYSSETLLIFHLFY